MPYFASDEPWSQSFPDHQNAGRKQTWQAGLPVVDGEEGTPFQSVASIADATSMVVNWGTEGVQYINTDITLTLARQPVSREIGLSATDRVEYDGIAVGTVKVFDRAGPLGHVHGDGTGQCVASGQLRERRVRRRGRPPRAVTGKPDSLRH